MRGGWSDEDFETRLAFDPNFSNYALTGREIEEEPGEGSLFNNELKRLYSLVSQERNKKGVCSVFFQSYLEEVQKFKNSKLEYWEKKLCLLDSRGGSIRFQDREEQRREIKWNIETGKNEYENKFSLGSGSIKEFSIHKWSHFFLNEKEFILYYFPVISFLRFALDNEVSKKKILETNPLFIQETGLILCCVGCEFQVACILISRILCIPISKIIRRGDPVQPDYILEVNGNEVFIGKYKKLISYSYFSSQVAIGFNFTIPEIPSLKWLALTKLFLSIVVIEEGIENFDNILEVVELFIKNSVFIFNNSLTQKRTLYLWFRKRYPLAPTLKIKKRIEPKPSPIILMKKTTLSKPLFPLVLIKNKNAILNK